MQLTKLLSTTSRTPATQPSLLAAFLQDFPDYGKYGKLEPRKKLYPILSVINVEASPFQSRFSQHAFPMPVILPGLRGAFVWNVEWVDDDQLSRVHDEMCVCASRAQ